MEPGQLTAAGLRNLPPEARALATSHLTLLKTLPIAFAPILLREISGYDWQFPVERLRLERQLTFLGGLDNAPPEAAMRGFRGITVPGHLQEEDWVADPSGFLEKLTAYLWSSHQIELFRRLAEEYQGALDKALPPVKPATARLGLVVLGPGISAPTSTLCRKLQPHGVLFTALEAEGGWPALLEHASQRGLAVTEEAKGGPGRGFRHWYIDGGAPDPAPPLAGVSYAELEPARTRLLTHVQDAMRSGNVGPEQMRSLLARLKPSDVGLLDTGSVGVLNRFKLSLFTEGSGTQIFATTFAQWAARECIRRAEPQTVLLRFAPRQLAGNMNRMLTPGSMAEGDPVGSLADAEMGAYYTWLEMRRLTGGEDLRFLVWFQGGSSALLIGPGLPGGASSDSKVSMPQLLKMIA